MNIPLIAAVVSGGYITRKSAITMYEETFEIAAKKWAVDKNLLKAIVKQESNFQADAIGDREHPNGPAYGLGQLLRLTAEKLGLDTDKLLDPATNINGVAQLVHNLMATYPTVREVISRYNQGTRKDAKLPSGKWKNQRYVDRVFLNYIHYTISDAFAWMDPIINRSDGHDE